jgi:hypothetical protein
MIKINILFYACVFAVACGCTSLSVVENRDELDRVIEKATYKHGALDYIEDTTYIDNTKNPSQIVYKKQKGIQVAPFREEVFTYTNGIISNINYYIYIDNVRTRAGGINCHFDASNKPVKFEYYSLTDGSARRTFMSGVDIYNYSNGVLSSRRIIEYEHDPSTESKIQLSQYLIYYENAGIKSMQTWVLEKVSGRIIKNEERDIKIIREMMLNIEKSMKERARGIRLLNI